jgi:hypothetical protein
MIPIASVSAALAILPVYHEDRDNPYKGAQLATVARAVAAVSRSREEAAYLITIGHHESGHSFRIHFGLCKSFECDHGRARGLFQNHQNGRSQQEWDGFVGLTLEATTASTVAALQHVRFAQRVCRGEPDPVIATFRAYAGRGCRGSLPGENKRVMTFQAVMRKL